MRNLHLLVVAATLAAAAPGVAFGQVPIYSRSPAYDAANVSVSGGAINGATVGATTPAAGSFTTLSSSSTTTLKGTTTNDSAAAGNVGEILSTTVASGAPVSLTSTVAANMTSVSLTAGDWDVSCSAYHNLAATTTLTVMQTGISTTSATLPASTGGTTDYVQWRQASAAPGGLIVQQVGPHRVLLSGTTTVFCVCNDTFATSTNAVYGTIRARRVR